MVRDVLKKSKRHTDTSSLYIYYLMAPLFEKKADYLQDVGLDVVEVVEPRLVLAHHDHLLGGWWVGLKYIWARTHTGHIKQRVYIYIYMCVCVCVCVYFLCV